MYKVLSRSDIWDCVWSSYVMGLSLVEYWPFRRGLVATLVNGVIDILDKTLKFFELVYQGIWSYKTYTSLKIFQYGYGCQSKKPCLRLRLHEFDSIGYGYQHVLVFSWSHILVFFWISFSIITGNRVLTACLIGIIFLLINSWPRYNHLDCHVTQ